MGSLLIEFVYLKILNYLYLSYVYQMTLKQRPFTIGLLLSLLSFFKFLMLQIILKQPALSICPQASSRIMAIKNCFYMIKRRYFAPNFILNGSLGMSGS